MTHFGSDKTYIPIEVEQALAKDELVFFCGAGISRYMNLPSFKGLVKDVCDRLLPEWIDDYPPLRRAWEQERYDVILGLLERPGMNYSLSNPAMMRKTVIRCLEEYDRSRIPTTHKALLDLSLLPGGGHRLVTTNFDRLFLDAELDLESDEIAKAPDLGAPRKDIWRKATFLHGVIDQDTDPEGRHLVLTEADFGHAYLFSRWAGNFIIDLFREFTVLMVGYSANDPVMRYLMTTFEFERNRGKDFGKAYALVSCTKENRRDVENEWKNIKQITPIPYLIPHIEDKEHKALHDTLEEWAGLKRGATHARRLRLQHIIGADPNDRGICDAMEHVALDEDLAKTFPEASPAINWLHALAGYERSEKNNDQCVIKMSQLAGGSNLAFPGTLIRGRMYHISMWLVKHLDKKELVHWVIDSGGVLHPDFRGDIRRALSKEWEERDLPPRMRTFWEIVSSEEYARDHAGDREISLSSELTTLRNLDGSINHVSKTSWLSLFRPRIKFEKEWNSMESDSGELSNIFNIEIELADRNLIPTIRKSLENDSNKEESLSICAEDFTNLLKWAMEKASSAVPVTCYNDFFHIWHSSISEHSQNEHLRSWTHLVDLVRDSFDAMMVKKPESAHALFRMWQGYPYPLFYRLSLYAATKHPALDESIILQLLEDTEKKVLWASSTKVEVLRYLRERSHTEKEVVQLVQLILEGLPRDMIREDFPDEEFLKLKERSIRLRLERLSQSGVVLPVEAQGELARLHKEYSNESIDEEMSDFSTWHETGFKGDTRSFESKSVEEIRTELLEASEPREEDGILSGAVNSEFRSLATMQPGKAISVLDSLSPEKHKERPWILYAALNGIISIGDQNKPSDERSEFFCHAVKHLISEEYLINKCRTPLADGMQKDAAILSKIIPGQYFDLWCKILNFIQKDPSENRSGVGFDSHNTDAWRLGEALMKIFWSRYSGAALPGSKIPKDLLPFFNDLVRAENESVLPALYHLGVDACPLYCIDSDWTRDNLFPLMDWKNPRLAEAVWYGYLCDRRMNNDFFREIKPMFLAAIKHYGENEAGDDADQGEITAGGSDNPDNLARMLFGVCCEVPGKFFEPREVNKALRYMNVRQLEQIAWCMWQTIDRAGDKAEALWEKLIGPRFTEYWPKTAIHMNQKVTMFLVETALVCREKFPDAIKRVMDVIPPTTDISFLLYRLTDNEEEKFTPVFAHPRELLEFLDHYIKKEDVFHKSKPLCKILDRILEQDKTLEKDLRYQRLRGYARS